MKQKYVFDFNKKVLKIKSNSIYQIIKFELSILLFLISFHCSPYLELKSKKKKYENIRKSNFKESIKFKQDDLTIVTAYYKIKSKHLYSEYLKRLKDFVKLNHSIVFFTSKTYINTIKKMRPKNLYYKTIFIEMELEDFYSYKKFGKEFNESFYIDRENSYHTVPLYLIWAEKCSFLKKAILNNYFNSKCFYWVDAGLFMKPHLIDKYINWPSTKKCFENPRVLINSIRKINNSERKDILNFDLKAHKQFQRKTNVAGGIFGGQPKYLLKFIYYYYYTIKLFIRHKIFIGKDQNLFAYVVFSHPEIINLVHSGNFFYFLKYLS